VQTGKVVRFDEVRGYGFIAPDGGGEDVFVHANVLSDDQHSLSPGVQVEFEAVAGDRGLKASTVRVVRPASPYVDPLGPMDPGADFEDGMCDVLTERVFIQEVTERLLETMPDLTAGQVRTMRSQLLDLARGHGWVDN
jgi:cold shock protein